MVGAYIILDLTLSCPLIWIYFAILSTFYLSGPVIITVIIS